MRIELKDVSYAYGPKRNKRKPEGPRILDRIELVIEPGETVALAGRSGSGKSTLLQLIKGFLEPAEGSLLLDGTAPYAAKRPELFDRIGYIFQYPEHQLFARTVREDIAFGLRSRKLSEEETDIKVREAMQAVGLDYEVYAERSPFELSGGEKRRAAIAGVIVLEPEVLILDEPTAGLDLPSRQGLFRLLERLNRTGTTILWVSHQLEEILAHAPRLLVLSGNRLLADGRPAELLSDPRVLEPLGWVEPEALAVSRLLASLGLIPEGTLLSAQEAAAVAADYWRRNRKASGQPG